MRLADVLAAMSLGLCLAGLGIFLVQVTLEYLNRRAHLSVAIRVTRFSEWRNRFLDWVAQFVLGPPKRLDHEPMYSTVIAALVLVGAFWLTLGPLPQSVIFTFPNSTQITLATCLFLGSATCLYGILMGTPFEAKRVILNAWRTRTGGALLPPLDLRQAYRVGASGVPAVVVSLSYDTYITVTQTPVGWTGPNVLMLGFICLGLSIQWLRFLMENRRINQALPMLLAQEAARRAISGEGPQ